MTTCTRGERKNISGLKAASLAIHLYPDTFYFIFFLSPFALFLMMLYGLIQNKFKFSLRRVAV